MVLFGVYASRCAQIIPLSGGEKDVLPPKVVKSIPENASAVFDKNEVMIEFDEYILLRDLQNQLIITPKLKEQADVQARSKIVSIKFKEALKPNTTYSINFGDAITDLHEGNKLSGYEYVFSTGQNLDSLKLSGKLIDAFTLEPVKDVWVMLYENNSDSIVYKEKPDYLAKSNDKGMYELRYLKKGKYKLFALQDKNSNFLYDAGEPISYPIRTATTIEKNDTLNMFMFKENASKVYIKKVNQPYQGKAQIFFNAPPETIDNILVKNKHAVFQKENIAWSLSKFRDTVNFYYNAIYDDTLTIYIRYNQNMIDSCKISIVKKGELERLLSKKRMPFELYPSFNSSQAYPYYKPIAFRTNRMQSALIPNKILIIDEKDTIRVAMNNIKQQGPDSLYIHYKLSPAKEYKLLILPGAFSDNVFNSNDTLKYKLTTQRSDYYSSLRIKLQVPVEQNWIIQLYNSKGQLVSERIFTSVNTTNEILFDKVSADQYSLKLISDSNKDGRYTPGKYSGKSFPEKVYNYSPVIKILADWEAEIEWKVK